MNRHLDGTAPLPKISAHTNIWGIGAIMFELLTHEAVVYYLTDDEWTVNEAFFDIPNVRTPRYSGALTELIKLCLMPEPWDRPSIEELELKIGAKCQRIMNEYTANPSLQTQDRLYYAGSEINQMPPGDWNYWNPVVKDVPKPLDLPDPKEPKNPFTETIKYPPFPTSELDGPEEERGEVQETRVKSSDDDDDDKNNWRYDGNGEDLWRDDDDDDEDTHHEASEGPKGDGVGKLIVVSDGTSSGRNGNDLKDPVVISDSDEEDELHERSERNEFNQGDEVDEGEENYWANENNERNPVVISDSDEEDELDEKSERNEVKHGDEGEEGSWANENNESNRGDGSEDESSSDDSDARRRMAIKKPPGT